MCKFDNNAKSDKTAKAKSIKPIKGVKNTFTNYDNKPTPIDTEDAREPVKPASKNIDQVAECIQWLKGNSKSMTFHATHKFKKADEEGYLHSLRGCSLLRVEFGNDIRRFFWIYNKDVADRFVEYINFSLKIEAHEMIMPTKCRFFLDIDLELDLDDKEHIIEQLLNEDVSGDVYQLDSLSNKLIDIYATAIKYSLEDHSIDATEIGFDYCATIRNREDKISIHLITNMILSHAENKAIAGSVKEMLNDYQENLKLDDYSATMLSKAIDDKQYRKHGSLALLHGWKKGVQSTIAKDWVVPNQSYWLTRSDEWIANVDDIITNYDIKTVSQYSNKEASNDFISAALQHVGSIPIYDPKYFDIERLRGEGCFRRPARTSPSHCSVCDKKHDRDHNLVLIFNEEQGFATWKCNRSPESKAKRFYFVPKEIEVSETDIEEFVAKTDSTAQSQLADEMSKAIDLESENRKDLSPKEKNQMKVDDNEAIMRVLRTISEQVGNLPDSLFKTKNMTINEFLLTRYWDSPESFATGFRMCHAFLTNNGNPKYLVKYLECTKYESGDIIKSVCYKEYGLKEQKDAMECAMFNIKDTKENKWVRVSLYQIYCNVWQAKSTYTCAKFIPHSPFEKPQTRNDDGGRILNTFGGWLHEYDPDFVIDQELVNVWLFHGREVISDGDDEYFEYLMNWFAHLIQKPLIKTATVPLIKSDQRAGKGQYFMVIMVYTVNPDLCLMTGNMDDIVGNFNSLSQDKLLIILDEAVDAKDKSGVSKFKNMTAEGRQTINEKYKAQKSIQSFSNYACLTNHDFDTMIEKDQGRMIPKVASNKYCYDTNYWKNYRSKLLNLNAGKHIFHWLCRRDISNFNVRQIPRGNYEKELAKAQVNSCVKWMLDVRQKLLDGADETTKKWTSDECYEKYKEWAPNNLNSKSGLLSKMSFGKIMNEYKIPLKQMRKVLDEEERSKWITRIGITLPSDPNKQCSIRYREISFNVLTECLSSVLTKDEQNEKIE